MSTRTCILALLAAGLSGGPAFAFTAYVSNEKGNSITVVDTETKQVVKTVDVGQRPRGITLSHDGKFLYLCASDDDTDTRQNAIFNTEPTSRLTPLRFAIEQGLRHLIYVSHSANLSQRQIELLYIDR